LSSRISIDPITRLEGHGRIEIFLDDAGEVADVYFQVPELRGFEQFCIGRPAEEMPLITSRICGVCPEAHHIAAVKALDVLFGVEPPPAARKIREVLYMAFFVTDHTTHFYALGGPDFIVGPDAPPHERNILGVARKVGLDLAGEVLGCRARNHLVIAALGGRGIHPVGGVPGGWSKAVEPELQEEIAVCARQNVAFAEKSLAVFADLVLGNEVYRELLLSDVYRHDTYSMGTVDAEQQPNFYDGTIRVVAPDGRPLLAYPAADYARHIAERAEPWTYLKFPYLKAVGWQGLTDGCASGIYCATPLSRLNVARRMATPNAQRHFEELYRFFSIDPAAPERPPIQYRLANHWARLIELLYAAERMLELAEDPELTSRHVRVLPSAATIRGEGVGSVEAPRGTLIHHYVSDARGILRQVNLIVGTTNNHAPIALSIKRAARQLIHGGKVIEEGLLNRIEMAFRLYDPCLSCATHALPGRGPLIVTVRDAAGQIVREVGRGQP
jgi:F420-non-reducing hydrogenase large subunit